MSGVNKVILLGNLGKDPEIKELENNKVANVSIATSEVYKDKDGERQEKTEWHRVVMWGKLAELAEKYLQKGSMVYVEGRLKTRQWQDQDGNTKYATEIVASSMTFVGGKPADKSKQPSTGHDQVEGDPPADEEDDLPF